ncbi:LuxR family transcriptional regulator [Psychromarinibacter sp. C21-152]|uniref:LuxR family transcriptional regulator n=1 Tax=Psychromarinibacter sediminicola TaxID=3033385 RepID=A0AAE3NVU2_9RHOB|nr:LuxR family transcriptional regulator [Psychromarinibacter sediminicola]MDF0602609.1 LuxR family transcriptional regulator [Psychromarinibacter sediminicola]
MQGRLDSLIEGLQNVRDLDALQTEIKDLRALFDVEHVTYHSVNGTEHGYAATTYSLDWSDQYFSEDYARIDPVVQGCFRRFHPVDWRRLDWSGKVARDFMGEARANGVGNQGFSIPIRGPSGQFALFTISDARTDSAWEKFTEAHTRDLILAAHFINQRALEIERGSDEARLQSLSPREIDVCTLLAMGYSRAQAAGSLQISEHTLRVYVESARFKLGATNTIHAVAKALTMGLLVV